MQFLPDSYRIELMPHDLYEPYHTLTTHHYQNTSDRTSDMHYHTCAEFGICRAGHGVFFIGAKMIPFHEGCISYMPAGVPHIASSPQNQPSEWNFLFADPELWGNMIIPNKGFVVQDPDMMMLLEMTLDSLRHSTDNGRYYKALIHAFFAREACLRASNVEDFNVKKHLQVMPAIQHIANYYSQPIQVSDLAKICQMSPSLFHRVFLAGVGMSPIAYLNAVRISAAEAWLLTKEDSITDIALGVGFSCASSLYRQFVKKHGMSPNDFRKQTESN